ncbi:hypothetical protein K6119_06165 [Paracrocinitomix mangrovi]|uniref:M14 family zinc carboxypeptidase n=1 Tax=Paracrocinitomix mangrovi TaxID=2862509 RepID=UPI001C8DD635|nr:M14 family zinc carboxypeptidase [Paracrocinitomix mangrovi]UKN03096.1 hypothetical protein K6119_06165 [Paracrocinitomix mangrovi]
MKIFYLLIFLVSCYSVLGQAPYTKNQTYTYDQLQDEYRILEQNNPRYCKLIQFGKSDFGKNIQLFIINKDGKFKKEEFGKKTVLLINNAIHPGEPCGVDASVKLAQELLDNPKNIPDSVIIGIIPMYNVGGAHNRNCCSRANQNGPEEYGFRGNAKNLDLNRDYIKADTKNTRTFYKIFHYLNPHVFIDTHTSDGADYQYTMTLITSQIDKMHPLLGNMVKKQMNPVLYDEMKKSNWEMIPYVHGIRGTPDDGIKDFLETPRFSTGYTNLFNTLSFVSEAHMLKKYEDRVLSTYSLLKVMIKYMDDNSYKLYKLKEEADKQTAQMEYMPINWELDTTKFDMLQFKGYEAEYSKSEITGQRKLHYNQDKPYDKEIRYFNRYAVIDSVKRPTYYIIPQAWLDVIVRLQLNDIKMYQTTEDLELETEVYYIDDYTTVSHPYEGHYLHRNTTVSKQIQTMTIHKGDYVVPTNNANAQFIVQTLEPHAVDSYFAWNYFDEILQQKEWFSAYIFEETAKQMLADNPELKKQFEAKKKADEEFANDAFSQLYYLYKLSDNYERTYNRYPIYRYMKPLKEKDIEDARLIICG